MPSCAGFLEPRKSRLFTSVSNAKNFICSFSMSISIDFSAIRSWNVSRSPKLPKNPLKTLFCCSRSSKVIEFGGNREPVYNFLLVINRNLGPIHWRPHLSSDCCIGLEQFAEVSPVIAVIASFQIENWTFCPVLQTWLRTSHCTDYYYVTPLFRLIVMCPCSLKT